MHSPIAALSFDLDDTFWDSLPVLARAEMRLRDYLRQNYPRIVEHYHNRDVRQIMLEATEHAGKHSHDVTALRKIALTLAARRANYGAELVELAFAEFFVARNQVQLYPDVHSTLSALAERFPLASVTNGNADIGLVGLQHYFRVSLSPISIGKAKPAPEIFHAACAALAVDPAQTAHIGDDPLMDVVGAQDAGLRAIWFNPSGRPWLGKKPPDAEIRCLADLLVLLS